ncbi:ArsR/SmtB family transcription factor [Streptomyces sp. NPDC002870]|uniref:ArsR/SmtB family transcription factor n=1 Tax=Streptomyces sp. NPDC002870 TaxID=3364666 RepID=UPI0036C59132
MLGAAVQQRSTATPATRLDALRLLAEPHTTTSLARALHVSNATTSSHAAVLRSAGMATTTRTGRSFTHQRTALGTLVAGGWPP